MRLERPPSLLLLPKIISELVIVGTDYSNSKQVTYKTQ